MPWLIVQSLHGDLNHCIKPGAARTPCGCKATGWQLMLAQVGEVLRPACKRCRAAMDHSASPLKRKPRKPKLKSVAIPLDEEIPSCCVS